MSTYKEADGEHFVGVDGIDYTVVQWLGQHYVLAVRRYDELPTITYIVEVPLEA